MYILLIPLSTIPAAPIADGTSKFIGNITNRWVTPATSHFLDYWNQVTPENEGKWENVESTRDVMDWKWLDSSYNFAKKK